MACSSERPPGEGAPAPPPDPALAVLEAVRRAAGARPGPWRVGFSGGMDSTVLLDAARRVLAPERLAAVHVHHGLHPSAGAWEEHCREAARRLGVALDVRRAAVCAGGGSGGLEAAARRARYAAFRAALPAGGALLLAHHLDDQAETVLLRLLRGAGPAGLAAMRPETEVQGLGVVRPFLALPRAVLREYAERRGLAWVEDPANADPAHARSYLRGEVLPRLVRRWPDAPAALAGFAERAGESAALLGALAAEDLERLRGREPGTLRAEALAALPPARAANALRAWLAGRHGGLPPSRRWLRTVIEEVAGAAPDRCPEARRGGVWVRRYRGDLHTGRTRDEPAPAELPARTAWRLAAPLELPHGRLAAVRACGAADLALSAARLPDTVEVRFRRGGERCRPAGRGHAKPLKHLLQELGAPPWTRAALPLVFVGERLACVPGLFVCEPFAAGGDEPAWRIDWTPGAGAAGLA